MIFNFKILKAYKQLTFSIFFHEDLRQQIRLSLKKKQQFIGCDEAV